MKTHTAISAHIIILTLVCAGVSLAGAKNSPTDFLKSKDQQLKPLLTNTEKNKTKIVSTIAGMLDFDTLCKDSLGKYWEPRTEAERKDFSDTLRALIEKNVVKRLKDTKDNLITYGNETVSGENAWVVTTVKIGTGPRADETEIVYKLRRKGASWIVVDMVTDGISLVSNYKDQFNSHITNEGWAGLMKKMKDKLAEKDPPASSKSSLK